MRKFGAAAAAFAALFLSQPAYAGFTGPMTIQGVDIGDSGVLTIQFEEEMCGPGGTRRVFIPRTASYYNDALALALSAYATGAPVRAWIDTCVGAQVPAVRLIQGSVW